jgi:hypothetical protein
MSIDKKAFGLSDSLVSAVNEALKGGQKKLDKNHNGKLDSQDFKMLRKEDRKQQDAVDEQSPAEYAKANFKHGMMGHDKKMKNEVADGNKANFKQNMKEGPEEKDATNPKQGSSVDPKKRSIGEAATKMVAKPQYDKARPAFSGANAVADMDARKTEVQRKIAQKQAAFQQSKANKRISGSPVKEAKCTCGEGKGSKMTCEVCNSDKKSLKGGKEPILMNPPLREASNLPKAVVTKGHEIAKSLIKHRSKVKEPYAVGMATAKKSAGIKEDAEQVDELSKETMKSYIKAVDKRGEGVKRGTGLNTASQKIAKQEPTSTLKKTVDAIKNTPHGKMKSSSVYKFGASHAELQKRSSKKD